MLPDPEHTRGWLVAVYADGRRICDYPPTPFLSALSLWRAVRRCWPQWQARLSPPTGSRLAALWPARWSA
ncbi:MAG: hypothetical protein QOF58_6646 [Pseudonocardiales bacterium]|nr:hypothetical protein [Pseudonocardiales bacterium]